MPKDCRDTALSFLEYRERSIHEVKQHLKSKGFDHNEIEKELEALKKLHYLDDARYCENYIRYGKNKGRGPARLRMELNQKGICSELIQDSLKANFSRQQEKESAMKEAEKLIRLNSFYPGKADEEETDEWEQDARKNKLDEKTIAKIGRKLASLGYSTDVIYEVIGRIRSF